MKSLKNQRGQSAVEYILILTLSVAIILGAIYQLNSAFKVWADTYFGDYLTCLLETGELPGLSANDPNATCAAEFKKFNIADGSPLVGAPIGSGGDGSGGANNNSDDENASSRTAGQNTPSADGGGSNDSRFGSNRSGRGGSRFRARPNGASFADGAEKKGDQVAESNVQAINQGGRGVRIPIQESEEIRRNRAKKELREKTRTKVTKQEVDEAERAGAPVRMKVVARKPSADTSYEGIDLSFGNLLRYLIIAIIIILIIVFIGGQALQVSKSTE